MDDLPLYLVDDVVARSWTPFAETRPVGEILFGCMRLRERVERVFGRVVAAHIVGESLLDDTEPTAPGASRAVGGRGAMALERVDPAAGGIYVLSRFVPNLGISLGGSLRPGAITLEGRVVGWILAPGDSKDPIGTWIDGEIDPADHPSVRVRGLLLESPWHLVERNPDRIRRDLEVLHPEQTPTRHPTGVVQVGPGEVSLGEGASIEPGVYIDTRAGGVRLEAGARVEGPARLVGPLWIGPGTVVFGGTIGASSVGPVSKIRGEVVDSVLLGYDNKAHDGHLGHAMVGEWVNLGAMTTNSDLKNNYGSVRVTTATGEIDTGLAKVGCFLGDHVKTGIGTLLDTGTVIGAGSMVLGPGPAPKYLPPFSWGGADTAYEIGRFLETMEKVFARRDRTVDEAERSVLRRLWQRTWGGETG